MTREGGTRTEQHPPDRNSASLMEFRDELIDVLHDARESLIEHAVKLPLNRRDHGPALVKIDAAIDKLAELKS